MIYVGILLLSLPLVIGGLIMPLYHMIDCLKNGGDWEYYGEQVLSFITAFVICVGFVLIVIGLGGRQ